ncbi:DUF5684 domain-containing protein [Amycolatopsis keratiniphila]|uniref:Signal peptidase I n=1 Tax=Amycolatopsis keratiniphila subsp. keratiniphila TaxID=227715 RepID=A0A1W2LZI4_9PSEU|nr:DUF5684 domain-containing protein [Amycolatopsis keratiniphila]ONF72646.1 hypothetical protein AVR91_0210715 [Amycolatopsis keratiniphila subsp. keratiniphila]
MDDDINSVPILIITLILALLYIAALWRVFTKAGRPGWAAIIPIYNLYILTKVAGRSGWWVVGLLIPVVDIVAGIVVSLGVAKSFGKSGAFGFFGLFVFGFIGYPILALGSAQYAGPESSTSFQHA